MQRHQTLAQSQNDAPIERLIRAIGFVFIVAALVSLIWLLLASAFSVWVTVGDAQGGLPAWPLRAAIVGMGVLVATVSATGAVRWCRRMQN